MQLNYLPYRFFEGKPETKIKKDECSYFTFKILLLNLFILLSQDEGFKSYVTFPKARFKKQVEYEVR